MIPKTAKVRAVISEYSAVKSKLTIDEMWKENGFSAWLASLR